MNNDTPKTDAKTSRKSHTFDDQEQCPSDKVSADLARELKRENNALRAALADLTAWGDTLPDIASAAQRAEYKADYARAVALLPKT